MIYFTRLGLGQHARVPNDGHLEGYHVMRVMSVWRTKYKRNLAFYGEMRINDYIEDGSGYMAALNVTGQRHT